MIITFITANPGTGWVAVEKSVKGAGAERKREVRDRLLKAGTLVNVVTDEDVDVVLDHCPERRRARLHLATDPTLTICVRTPTQTRHRLRWTWGEGGVLGTVSPHLCRVSRP